METKLKIQELWDYLGVCDDEVLIVGAHNAATDKDQFIIAEARGHGLHLTTSDNIIDAISDRPFQLIQQRDVYGRYVIPSVKRIIEDKKQDY